MNTPTQTPAVATHTQFQIARLNHALNNELSASYPILAAHGYIETTPSGYRDPGGAGVVMQRIRNLIAALQSAKE